MGTTHRVGRLQGPDPGKKVEAKLLDF